MDHLLNLSEQVILITGGAGAIGRVVVRVLVEHGARVAVNDVLAPEQAHEALVAAGVPLDGVAYFPGDVTRVEAADGLLDAVEARWQRPTVVACHVGMVDAYPIEGYPMAEFDRLFNLNVRGTFLVAQAAARRWRAAREPGLLLFTTSWVQDVPWPEIGPYSASKAAMKALMRSFARELAPYGIRANAVAPGIVGVGMAKRQWDTDPGYRARAQKAIPLGEMQSPESVAHAFLFLCSPMADYMTGSVLLVDGGCSLYPMD